MEKNATTIAILFSRMSHDMGVMSEWGDDDSALYDEIESADAETFREYWDTFCGLVLDDDIARYALAERIRAWWQDVEGLAWQDVDDVESFLYGVTNYPDGLAENINDEMSAWEDIPDHIANEGCQLVEILSGIAA